MSKQTHHHFFHRSILLWYSRHRRPLPWRNTRNPYKVLLSEIMSQQTQVSRVAEFYHRWLKKFPSLSSVALANTADVLRAWSGLGYNSRALRFHRLAKIIVENFHSIVPNKSEILLTLPGIGRYTAHALCCFAFRQRVPVVDVNIRRIITRWTRAVQSSSEYMAENDAWVIAEQFLPRQKWDLWNQALMDFGAAVCTARKPSCSACPVTKHCISAHAQAFAQSPKKIIKKEPVWRGKPRRLYRGKILSLLHHHVLKPEEIAAMLWKMFSSRDVAWIERLLTVMEKDGLLKNSRGKYGIVS